VPIDRGDAVTVLEEASLFLSTASPDDIEHERQEMESRHKCRLAIHESESVTRSGAICTRVTWRILD
jgi:hypothetical protein